MRRLLVVLSLLTLMALPAVPAVGFPVAADAASYATCGRVFPDPHAYWPSPEQAPGQSPWAKGNAQCRAVDFLGWEETLAGLDFMATELFPDFVEVYDLSDPDGEFADVLDQATGEGLSAGLPTADLGREQVPMYLVRVTDEEHPTPIDDREHFVYALGIHGIERAGVEGGIRAIEDLATWASCEKHGHESPANCAAEGTIPHPLLETMPDESITAGDALRQTSVWFILSNPDGWRRGDKQEAGFFYQRYNGNGVDLNRDWPTKGYTFRPYTPFSEPETRAVGKALQHVKGDWAAGIDLHGQLIDRAFSFTLIGGAERPFDKDRRVLDFVKGAWADAEQRLSWNPLIKSNDEPPPCAFASSGEDCDPSNRIYGVQWGTIWDTIAYTVTGALGDWIDSPIGLNADGIDNEMSMSHLSNCGIGTCFLPDFEQLHVDGNKSLIYAQIHYRLAETDTAFRYEGRAGYLSHDQRVTHDGSPLSTAPAFTDLPPQDGFDVTLNHAGDVTTHEFEVLGPQDGVYNGGLRVMVTWNNVQGVAAGSLNTISLDRYRVGEEDPQLEEGWEVVNSYFNQSPVYLQGGAQLDANMPLPGRYRIRIQGVEPSQFHADAQFLTEQAWPDPGQLPYDVSNLDFFDDLQPFVSAPDNLAAVPVTDVVSGSVDLATFDTLVVADGALLPGWVDQEAVVPAGPTQDTIEESIFCDCAPGAGARSPATSALFEFEVEPGQSQLDAEVTSDTVVDPDLYLQRQNEDGSWSGDLAHGETGRTGLETLTLSAPTAGTYRLEIHNWAGAPGPVDITIAFGGEDGQVQAAEVQVARADGWTDADRDAMAATLRAFVEQGGNLVLTDDALRALAWMDVVAADAIVQRSVYAGHVEFTADGGSTSSYGDPLAANVNQPGAAEGPNFRHQTTEPVPIGYAIQNPGGGDLNSLPQWAVTRDAFEEAGGRVVGTLGGSDVTLGEIGLGDGVIRIIGSLLPVPTQEFDHPYGLSSYGVTYTGYEVLRNALDWANPNGRADATPDAADDPPAARPPLPATGGGLALLALLALGVVTVSRRVSARRGAGS